MTVNGSIQQKAHQIVQMGRAVRLVWHSGPKWIMVNAVLIFFRGVLPLLSLYLIKLVIDAVMAALERAFLRNAQLIALDEPTSALDPGASIRFQEIL